MLLSRWLNAFTSRLSVRGTKNRVGTRRSPGRGTSQATQTASWIVGPNGSGNSAEFSSAVERLEDRLVLTAFDYGDAPDSYGTLLASNGARHDDAGAFLGAKVDLENDGQPSANATSDDSNAGVTRSVATYATSAPAYNFVNISGTGTSVSLSDDSFSSSISLPFNFNFFGSTKSALFIASDGYLSFSGDDSSYSSTSIPDVGTPNDFIAGLWVDLDPSLGGSVTYQTMGSVGSRVFIVQFTNIQHYSVGNAVTFQFKLFEGTNNIEVHYQSAPSDGETHVAGVENSDGTIGVEFFEGTGAIASNSAVQYTPTLGGAASVGDDEDGITFLSDLLISSNGSTTASVDVDLRNADSLGSHLDAWLDLNHDGDFNDANEKVINNVNLGSTDGLKRVSFTIAQDFGANVIAGATFMRFRLSSTGNLASTGYAADGEVEDYQVDLQLAGGEGQVLDLPTGGGGYTFDLNGGQIRVRDANGVVVQSYPQGDNEFLQINGTDAGDETLIVDFSGGNPIPFFGLSFDGGEGLNDHDFVRAQGYNLNTADGNADVIVNHNGTENGSVDFAGLGTIFFDNIEPLILAGTAADLVINLPAGGNPDALLANDTNANFPGNGTNIAGRSAIDGSTFEYTEFVNPTNSLTINLGTGGDSIEVRTMEVGAGAFNPATGTIIQGGALNDTFINTNNNAGTIMRFLGGAGNDTFTINATLTGQIDGQADNGGGGDTLNGTAIDNLTLLGSDANGFNGTEANIASLLGVGGNFDGIDSFVGQPGGSIFGINVASTWSVNGATVSYSDGSNTAVISGFGSLVGGTASDQFTVTAASNFDLLGGNFGNTGDDTFTINATLSGGVFGFDGNDILQGSQITDVTLLGINAFLNDGYAGSEADITGLFFGIDILVSTPGNGILRNGTGNSATWNIGNPQTNYVDDPTGGTLATTGFTNLNAGNQGDLFNLPLGVTFNGQINGGTGLDTLQGSGVDAVTLTTSNATGYSGNENSITGANPGFEGIDEINGNDQVGSTITGRDFGSVWTLNGANHTYNDGLFDLPFSGFLNVQGGSSGDTFNVVADTTLDEVRGGLGGDTFNFNTVGADLTGLIDGQGGLDLLQGTQINNIRMTGSTAVGEFTGTEDNISGGFSGIGNIVGNGTGTFAGNNAFAGTWALNGATTYNDGQVGGPINVAGFANLQASDAGDTFNVTGNTIANILGGASADTINLTATLTGNIAAGGGNDLGNFNSSSALVTGNIDGGTSMTLNFAGFGTPVTVNLNNPGSIDGFGGTVNGIGGTIDNITTIIGSAGNDTLVGDDVTSTWNGLGSAAQTYTTGAGVAQRTVRFSGIETLQGNSGADTFNTTVTDNTLRLRGGAGNDRFNHAADQTPGFIDGQTGTDTVDYSLDLGSYPYNLVLGTTEGFGDSEVSDNIEVLNAGTGLDTLRGVVGADAVWTQNTTQTYQHTASGRVLTISGFDTWQGSTGVDTYGIVTTNAAAITLAGGTGNDQFFLDVPFNGHIDGQGGTDALRLFGVNSTVSVNGVGTTDGLQGDSNQINGASSEFDNINTFQAAAAGGTFTGGNTNSTWTVNGAVNSTYSDGVVTVGLTGFANLQGNGGIDTFNVIAPSAFNLLGGAGADVFDVDATLTGFISGEGGSDTLRGDTINDVQLINADINGFIGTEGSINPGFLGIDAIEGSNTVDSVLRTVNALFSAVWTINGAASSYTTFGLTLGILGNWDTLVGGQGIDTYNITGATDVDLVSDPVTALGTPPTFIVGQSAADIFVVGAVLTGNIFSGPGLDVVRALAAGQVTGTVDLGNTGTIDLSAQVVSRTVNLTAVGTIDGFQGNVPGVIGSFNNMTTLIGGAANDTLVGQNATAVWNLTAANRTYVSGGQTLTISSMETLQGGSGVDTFNVTAPHAGDLLGGLGNDFFNTNSQVTQSLGVGGVVDGQGGSDTVQGNVIDAVVITNADANGFDGTEPDFASGFNDIEAFGGNGGASSTITGNNSSAIWNLTAFPQTYITNGQSLGFGNFGTLIGGNVDDRFNVTVGSTFTLQGAAGDDVFDIDAVLFGNVDGGTGSNTLQGNFFTNSVITNLDATGADGTALGAVTGGYVEIDNLIGSAGGTLTGLNVASAWNLALAPTYVTAGGTVGFIGFSTLQGGSDVDTFTASANNSIYNILAGTGADVVVINAGATLTGNVSTEAGNDRVQFAANTGNIVGNVDFGSSGILDYSALASPVSVTLNATGSIDGFRGLAGGASLISGTFDNLTTLFGGTGSDTLTGQNSAATWQLGGTQVYQSGGQSLTFSGLNSLVGGTGSDRFNYTVNNGASLNGGAGDDTFDIDVAMPTSNLAGGLGVDILQGDVINAITLTALDATGADGTEPDINGGVNSFIDIESINGNLGSITGIIGQAATWAVNAGASTYTSGGFTISVATFGTLQGNTGVDTYNVTGASAFNLLGGGGDDLFNINAALTGTVDGQSGTNDVLAGTQIDAVILTNVDASGADGTETSISGNFTDIETITGNGAGTTLTGVNAASLWNLDGSAQYSMDAGATFVNFGSFANLVGLGAVDTFNVTGPGPSAFNLTGGGSADLFNISATLTGNISAGVGNDVISINNGGSVSGNVDGGNTAHLNYGANAGPVTVTLTDIGTIDGFRGTATGIGGTFDNITTLTGSLGADTLNGDDQISVWNLAAVQTYVSQLQTLTFSGVENLTGNSNADTFNVTVNTTANLNGGLGNDRFTIAAATTLTGAINAGTGTDTLDGLGIDTVVLTAVDANGADGTEPSITGGFIDVEQIDGTAAGSLTGVNAANATWGLDGTPTYTIGVNSVGFTGFLNLNGSSGVDTFQVTANSTYNLFGSTGSDVFTISATLTGSLDGGGNSADTDTLNGTAINLVTLTASSNIDGFNGTEADITLNFTRIDTITGNGAVGSTLTGENAASIWDLDGSPTYTNTASLAVLNFSGFANLQGNAAADTFNVTLATTTNLLGGLGTDLFNIGATLTGSIDGQGGADTVSGTQIDNATITNLDANGADGTEASITLGFNNIETLTGNGGANTTLTGQAAVDSTWNLDGTPTYEDADGLLNFTAFRNLQGGGAIDTFNVTAASTFNLFGGAGADDVNISAALTGTVSTEAGLDTIDFILAGTVSGNVDGGTSAALTLNGLAAAANVVVTGNGTIDGFQGTIANVILGVSTFNNITTLVGHAGADSLTGANLANTWALGATQTLSTSTRTMQFSGFDTLQGGTNSDTFNVTVAPAAVVRLNGGAGTDLFDIDVAIPLTSINGESGIDTLQGDVVNIVTLTGSDAEGFDGNEADINAGFTSFDGIDVLTATGAGTLTGQNANATWRLDGTPTYEVGAFILAISGFLNLNGGTASDTYLVTALSTFNLDGGAGTDSFDIDATLTGTVNGGVGSDTLMGNLIDNLTITNVDANGADGTEASITGNFTDVESIIGNGGTLTGQAAVISTWTINGNNSSYSDADGTVAIQGFANYQGGGVQDTFNITGATTANLLGGAGTDLFDVGATLTGSINGQAGADTVQGAQINDVFLTFADANGFDMTETSVTGGINDIETLTGNGAAGSSLTGIFTTSSWDLDGTPTYTALGQTLNFTNFADLHGNASFDTFNVTANSSFNLFGGSSADVFNINNAALTSSLIAAGNIFSEGGDDVIHMIGNASIAGNLDGGTSAELDYSGFATAITVVFTAGGTIDGFFGTATGIGGTFDNIDTLRGSAQADTMTGLNAGGTFELNALNNASLTDTYTSGARTILFSGFFGTDTLQGGTGADRFNVNVATSGNLLGGAGSDVFNLNAALTGRVDGQGTDNYASTDVLQGSVIDAVILTNSDGFGFDGTETSISGNFTDIETITGNGVSGSTLTGQGIDIPMEAIDSVWLLDGSPTYTSGNVYFLNFSNFANLQGGAVVDEFQVTAPSTFNVDGGAGNDFFTINSTLTGSVTGGLGNDEVRGTQIDVAVLTNSDGSGFDGTEANITLGFNDIETLTGNGNVGTSLTGQNLTSTWGLDGTPTYTAAAGALNFTGFANLHGGTAVDTFNVTAATTENLFGGGSADIVNLSAALTGNISTEAGNDVINFLPSGQINGNIDGGTSALLNYSGYGSAVAVQLTGPGSIDGYTGTGTGINGTFDNITTLTGSAAADVLTGDDVNGVWNLGASQTYNTGTGSGARTLLFSAFETLQGNSAVDTFNITAATVEVLNGGGNDDIFNLNAVLTGSVNGESGTDTLQGTLVDVALIISQNASGFSGTENSITEVAGVPGFSGIDNLFANVNAIASSLTGQNAPVTWNLSNASTYQINGFTLNFSGFDTLQGGTFEDTFNVIGDSTFDSVLGGLGNDEFVIDATLNARLDGQGQNDTLRGTRINNVKLTASGATGFTGTEDDITGGFDGIDTIIGSGGTLQGRDVNSTWTLDGTPTYTDGSASLDFSGFDNLQGGSADDTFLVTADSTFNLLGGDGADLFDIDAVLNGAVRGEGAALTDNDTLQGNLINDVLLFGHETDGFFGFESDVAQSFFSIDTIIGNGGRIIGMSATSTWDLDGTPTYTQGTQVLDFSGFATLQGGEASDTFNVTAPSTFELRGGNGNDSFFFPAGRLNGTADGENGNDLLDGTGATAGLTLLGSRGNDTIIGSSFGDLLNGGSENDSILGMAGNDTITGGTGNDFLDGGAGLFDKLLEFPTGNVVLTNTALTGVGSDKLANIEEAEFFGGDENNFFDASKYTLGRVSLHGGAGDDTLYGTPLSDVYDGGAGFDKVIAVSLSNVIATNATIVNSTSVDSLTSVEALDITGHFTVGTTINAGAFTGPTTLTGGAGADRLTSGQGNSLLRGNAGNDILVGGKGWDQLFGGNDNDSLTGGLGNDTLNGEVGNDTLKGDAGDDVLSGGTGRDKLYGGVGQDYLDGGTDGDTLAGEDGHDTMFGGTGNDVMAGGTGHDTMDAGDGNDTMDGGDGDDSMLGGTGNDTILGGAGSDRINGGTGKDKINGGAGSNVIADSISEIDIVFALDINKLLV